YNSALAFTSLGVQVDQAVINASGLHSFRIHGELCHKTGSLLPREGEQPMYAQLYVHDPVEATNI
ncbi:hypothetical protein FIBSPDRAFT_764983, partial [Athelia psychrophila]